MSVLDESFKKPGSIPFKWEIRPGVPKLHPSLPLLINQEPPSSPAIRPPPAGFSFREPLVVEPRTRSFRSPLVSRPGYQSSSPRSSSSSSTMLCFPSPLLMLKKGRKRPNKLRPGTGSDPDSFYSDLDSSGPRWSVSTRKSPSPLRDSSSRFSSSFSSNRDDAEWAAAFAFF